MHRSILSLFVYSDLNDVLAYIAITLLGCPDLNDVSGSMPGQALPPMFDRLEAECQHHDGDLDKPFHLSYYSFFR